ncbi:MAG: hypothetical protein LJE89_05250 [Deltaproteobacteria bacterium]|nr:hypothetical protein [Deltaproteobacteria bacterium]
MFRKVFFAILLTIFLGGCQKPPNFEQEHPGAKGQPPELLGYYAAKEVHPGETWNIYLKAKDVDGDMKYIVAVLSVEGVDSSLSSEIWLKGEDRTEFDGYIFLNTPPGEILFEASVTKLIANIFIRDWAGNKSQTVKLPLSFEPGRTPEEVPPQWQQAANHELGYISNSLLGTENLGDTRRSF